MDKKKKAEIIIKRLSSYYKNPKTALNFSTPLELLIATILSAQATDKTVNTVTPELFKKFRSANDFASSSPEKIDQYIKKVNFHNNKSKSIYNCCKLLVEKFDGKVPKNMQDLLMLPGVARKTANVVLGQAFAISEGIVVDTHVRRISKKLGFTTQDDPVKIENDLMQIIPKKYWIDFPLLLINFGREFCPARPHICPDCPLKDLCPDL